MNYIIVRNDELYHHGIKGMKWGQRNGPPYPLGSDDYSVREKKEKYKQARKEAKSAKKAYKKAWNKAYYLSSNKALKEAKLREGLSMKADEAAKIAKEKYIEAKHERSNKEISELLGVSEKEADHIRKICKIAGISLATTAGLVAAGYLISRNREKLSNLPSKMIWSAKSSTGTVIGFNRGSFSKAIPLDDDRLFANTTSIGQKAKSNGYGFVNADFIKNAINNPKLHEDGSELLLNVRKNQVVSGSARRLSCWSTSQSYYLSELTGRDFCSKSFENLVDFNDFGKLYNKKPKIFDAFGNETTDFVGKFGKGFGRTKFDEEKGKALIANIFDKVGDSNNLTADGKRTVGFVNAAYRGATCTHQWNFDITKGSDGSKVLHMIDGYEGRRFTVAEKSSSGAINYIKGTGFSDNWNEFMGELYHYNADSVRFYAPSLDSVNPEALAHVILGKK